MAEIHSTSWRVCRASSGTSAAWRTRESELDRSPDRWAAQARSGKVPIQDGARIEAARDATPHSRWEKERGRAEARWPEGWSVAQEKADAVAASSGACHVASAAGGVEPAQPPLLPGHRAWLR